MLYLSSEVEPTSFHATSQDSRWITATQNEIEALNHTGIC